MKNFIVSLLFIIIASQAVHAADPAEILGRTMGKEIVRALVSSDTVAVYPAMVEASSAVVLDSVITNLQATILEAKIKILERSLLDKLLKEKALNLSGLIDAGNYTDMGSFIPASKLVFISLSVSGSSSRFTARIVDLKTAELGFIKEYSLDTSYVRTAPSTRAALVSPWSYELGRDPTTGETTYLITTPDIRNPEHHLKIFIYYKRNRSAALSTLKIGAGQYSYPSVALGSKQTFRWGEAEPLSEIWKDAAREVYYSNRCAPLPERALKKLLENDSLFLTSDDGGSFKFDISGLAQTLDDLGITVEELQKTAQFQ